MRDATCSITECDRRVAHRGWCNAHYLRWKRHGDPRAGSHPRNRNPDQCAADGCDRAAGSRGFCKTHYMRERRHGRLSDQRQCDARGCDGPAVTLGYCDRHYQRLRDLGSLDTNRRVNTYRAIHGHLDRVRGQAKNFSCVDCGRPAAHWSYNHQDPEPRFEPRHGSPYSLDPKFYEPRCTPCHAAFDRHPRMETA